MKGKIVAVGVWVLGTAALVSGALAGEPDVYGRFKCAGMTNTYTMSVSAYQHMLTGSCIASNVIALALVVGVVVFICYEIGKNVYILMKKSKKTKK